MSIILKSIVSNSITAEQAVLDMHEASSGYPKLIRLMYVWYSTILSQKFGKEPVYALLNKHALFDKHDSDKIIRRAARSFHYKYLKLCNEPVFRHELETNGIVGILSGHLLYVAHLCVKPNGKKYQVTCFSQGVGPVSDTQCDDIDSVLKSDFPIEAKLIKAHELPSVEHQFLPA